MYIFQQLIFLSVYIAGCSAVALALGCGLSKSKVCLPRMTKFLFGCASTPFVLGFYMLAVSIIPFRLYNFLYYMPVYLIAALYLYKERKYIGMCFHELGIPQILAKYKETLKNVWIIGICHLLIVQLYDFVENKLLFLLFVFMFSVVLYCVQELLLLRRQRRNIIETVIDFLILTIEYWLLYLTPFVLQIIFAKIDSDWVFIWGFILKLLCYAGCCVAIVLARADLVYSFKEEKSIKKHIEENLIYGLFILFLGSSFYFRNDTIMAKAALLVIVLLVLAGNGIRKARQCSKKEWIKSQTYCILACMMFIIVYAVFSQSLWPIAASDASEYISNAYEFVQDMSWKSINSYAGEPEGKLLGIIHHPNYVLYLGFALIHSFTNQMGFPHDFGVRVAFSANVIYFMLALLAISYLLKNSYKKYFTIIFPFTCITMRVILINGSRDSFRMIPLVQLAGLLAGIMMTENEKVEKDNYFLLAFYAACVMMGHPINAVQAAIIVAAYLLWCLINKRMAGNIIKLGIAGIVGFAVGAAQILAAYLDTGKLTGNLININEILENTDYYNNFMQYSHSRLLGSETYFDKLWIILSRDYGVVMVPALIIAVYVLVKAIRKKKLNDPKVFLALIVLLQAVTISDILSWSGFSLTEWYVKNIRYTLHLYVFAGMLMGVVLSEFLNKPDSEDNFASIVRIGMFVPLLCILVAWSGWDGMMRKQYVECYQVANEVISDLGDEKKLLIDNYYCNYYLSNKAISFFTTKCKDIREAQTMDELDKAFREENVGAVMIFDDFIDVYWKDTLLLKYLESDNYVKSVHESTLLTVYELTE